MAPMIEEYTEAWNELTSPGGPFAMTEIEVRGVPMRVFDSAPPSMRFVWELAAGNGDKDYVVFEDERFTYAESDAIIKALVRHLVDDLGVQRGDRVAIAMRNYPEWVFAYWAIVSIGAACVGMNAWWTTDEMKYGLVRLAPEGADLRQRAHRPCSPDSRRAAPRRRGGSVARHQRALRR